MVAVVSGNGLGLINTSLTQLGALFGGQAGIGQSRESQMVNIATGNLLLQDNDENLQVRGLDATFLRTYNSRGQLVDAGQDGWITGFERHVALTSGSLNFAGSTMTLYTGDGQGVLFTYSSPNIYTATTGRGAHDSLVWNGGSSTWTFTEGSTQRQETYADHADPALQGRLTKIVDAMTLAEFDVSYDSSNRVLMVQSQVGDKIAFGYDPTTGQLSSVTTIANGVTEAVVTYGYDSFGRLAYVQTDLTPGVTGDNQWSTTRAADDGHLFRTSYTYANQSDGTDLRIASVTDSDGVMVGYTYESDNVGGYRVKTVTQGSAADGSAQTVAFNYHVGSTDVTDASGRTWTYQYDTQGQLTAVFEPAVAGQRTVTSYTYTTSADSSGAGNVTQIKTTLGSAVLSQIDRSYDTNGNMLWQWTRVNGANAGAAAVQRTYSASNQVLTETLFTGLDPDGPGAMAPTGGLVTNYIYDSQSRLRFVVDAAGGVTERTYATTGNGIGQVASARHYLAATYTGSMTESALNGWVSTAQQATRSVSEYFYDSKGRLQQTVDYATVDSGGAGVLDANASITDFAYDAQGLLLQRIRVHGTGRSLTSVPAGSETTEYIYDGMGRLLSALTRNSNTLATDDANAIATIYAYTDSANQIKVTLDTGAIRTEARNAAGQLLSVSDAGLVAGALVTRTTQNFYDATGRLRAVQDATGARNYCFYDAAGRLNARVDATGAVTSLLYDGMDRVIQTVSYSTRVDTSAWLSGGAVTVDTLVYSAKPLPLLAGQAWVATDAVNDRNGIRSYDALGRLSTQTDAAGLVTTYAYDGASNLLSITIAKPGDGSVIPRVTRFFYDSVNRQVATLDAAGFLTESVFDPGGRLVMTIRYATLTLPANRASGTLTQLRPAADATNDQVTRFFRDGRDQLVGVLNAEGYLTENIYDEQANQRAVKAYAKRLTGLTGSETLSALRLLALTSPPVEALELTQRSFNGLGQLVTELNAEGTVTRYTYDEAGRLATIDAADATPDVREDNRRYDVFGNLIGELDGQGSLQLTPGLTGQQLDALYAQYGTTHSYDLLGRRTESIDAQGNKTWYFYDADGRQTFLVRGVADSNGVKNAQGEVTEMRYSAFGQVTDQFAYTGRIAIPQPGVRASVLSAIGTLSFVAATDSRRQMVYDVRGLMTRFTDAENVVSNYTYTAFGQLLQEQRATATSAAVTIQHAYDQRGLETGRTDALGVVGVQRSVAQGYDAFGRVITRTDALGTVSTFSYDRLGRQLGQSRTVEGRVEAVGTTYDAFDRVLSQTDAMGKVTTFVHGDSALSLTVTSPEGVVVTTVHNSFGQTVSITRPLANGSTYLTVYTYDKNGSLLSTSEQGKYISTNSYDVRGLLVRATDASGRTVGYGYDALGRVLTRVEDPDAGHLNLTTRYAYDGQGRQVTVTDGSGRVTAMSYDREGRLLQTAQDPSGLNLRTTYSYDAAGRRITVTEGAFTTAAQTVQYAFDALGRRTSEVVAPGALGLTTSYTYDANGNAVTRTDALGHVSHFVYNGDNELRFAVDALGDLTESTYDAAGRTVMTRIYAKPLAGLSNAPSIAEVQGLIAAQGLNNDGLDAVTYRIHDGDGRIVLVVDGAGCVHTTTFDSAGRVCMEVAYSNAASMTSALRASLKAGTATVANVLSNTAANPAADRVSYTWTDGADRTEIHIDALGQVDEIWFDGAGRPLGTYACATPIANFATNTALKAKLAIGAAGYLQLGLVFDTTRDLETCKAYDAAGRLNFTVDGMGNVVEFRHDAAGRIVQQLAYVTPIVLSASDRVALENGALTVASFITSAQTAAAHSSYQVYDAAGRVRYTVTRSQVGAAIVGVVSENHYDAAGRVIAQIRYAPTVAFDPTQTEAVLTGLITAAQGNLAANQHITRFVYDAAGRQRFSVSDAGTVTEQRFDAESRLTMTRNHGTLVPVIDYTEATLAAAVAGFTDTRQVSYGYDNAGRLTSTTDALNHTESYGYDGDGRRTSLTNKLGFAWTYVYDAAGRQVEIHTPQVMVSSAASTGAVTDINQSIVTKFGYDALGNVTSRTEAFGTTGARTTTYAYDARGNQIATTFPDAWTVNSSGVLVSTGITPSIHITYIALDQAVVQKDVRGNYSYKVYDLQGRLAYDIDANGYVTGYGYDAMGEAVRLTRYATKVSTSVLTTNGWSAGAAIRFDQMQIVGVLVSGTSDRTITTTFDVAGNKRIVTQASVSYRRADGTVATGSPRTEFEFNAYGQVVKESVLLEGTPGGADAKWAYRYHYYDDLGRNAMDVDAEGYVTTWSYTAQGEIAQRIEYARALSATAFNALTTATRPALPASGDAAIGYDRIMLYTYDALGRKASETAVARHYQTSGGGSGIRDVATTYIYDAVDEAISTTVDGVQTQTAYDALGRTTAILEAERSILASNFDTQLSGSTSATTNLNTAALYVQSSPYTTLRYDAFGNNVQVYRYANGWVHGQSAPTTSANDQSQTTQYDHQGRAVIARDAEGNLSYRHYDAADNVIEVDYRLDGNAGRWANVRSLMTYDAANQQLSTQVWRDRYLNATFQNTVGDLQEQVVYNAFGEIVSKGDALAVSAGKAAQYGYDAVGRMITCNAQGGVSRTYGYNLAGYQVAESHTVTVATGDVIVTTTQTNDRLGRAIKLTLPSYTDSLTVTSTVSQTVDRWGNVIQMTDPRGYITNISYNALNQKTQEIQPTVSVVDAAGIATSVRPTVNWFYGAQGRLEGTQDANGNISKFVYDAVNRQVQVVDALGNATLQAFDAFGQQRLTQNAMGYITFQGFDRNGRVTGQGDYLPNGSARSKATLQAYALDQNGDRIAVTDAIRTTAAPNGYTAYNDYDSRGLLLRSQSAMGVVMNYAYDASGHKTLQEDGDTTHIGVENWTTDYFGRTTAHTDLSGRTYGYVYDGSSAELITETTSDGLNRSTIYYANGQVRQTTEAGGPTTFYTYDAAGNRTVEETTTTDGQGQAVHVKTTTTFDSHNRILTVQQLDVLTGVQVLNVSYSYDAAGNRRHVNAASGYGAAGAQDAWYTYDADNRVSTANGAMVNGQIVLNGNTYGGYTEIYDAAGHVVGQQLWGYDTQTQTVGSLVSQYIVDLRGEITALYQPRLSTSAAQVVTTQSFDADSRLTSVTKYFTNGTKLAYGIDSAEGRPILEYIYVGGMLSSSTIYTYDADGRMLSQKQSERSKATSTFTNSWGSYTFLNWATAVGGGTDTRNQFTDLSVLSNVSTANYTGTNLGYDAAGRLKGYSYTTSSSTQTFLSNYIGRDIWLESSVAGSSTDTLDKPTTSTMAYDTAGRQISIREHTNYANVDDRLRYFAYDGQNEILRRRDGTVHNGVFTQSGTTAQVQAANHHQVYVNGQMVASTDEAGKVDVLSHVTGFANTNIGSSDVVVQDGDSLQSIAQRIYGNSSLWYVLAAANALDANATLVAGSTLKAPQVTTTNNDASTFKPYNPGDVTGPTTPGLPHIAPPPKSGCGTLGMIIMIVIAAVVTFYTFGALAPEMSAMIGGMAVGTIAGATITLGGAIAAGFIAGAVGSIASQAIGSAMGVAHFSWKQVAVDATVNALTEGFGAWGATTSTFGEAGSSAINDTRQLSTLGRVAQAMVGYGGSVVANAAVGRDPNFSWKAVAATAVSSFISAKLGDKLPLLGGDSSFGKFINNFEGNLFNGTVNAATRSAFGVGTFNWGQIATDAFGNALGSAAIQGTQNWQASQAPRMAFNPATGLYESVDEIQQDNAAINDTSAQQDDAVVTPLPDGPPVTVEALADPQAAGGAVPVGATGDRVVGATAANAPSESNKFLNKVFASLDPATLSNYKPEYLTLDSGTSWTGLTSNQQKMFVVADMSISMYHQALLDQIYSFGASGSSDFNSAFGGFGIGAGSNDFTASVTTGGFNFSLATPYLVDINPTGNSGIGIFGPYASVHQSEYIDALDAFNKTTFTFHTGSNANGDLATTNAHFGVNNNDTLGPTRNIDIWGGDFTLAYLNQAATSITAGEAALGYSIPTAQGFDGVIGTIFHETGHTFLFDPSLPDYQSMVNGPPSAMPLSAWHVQYEQDAEGWLNQLTSDGATNYVGIQPATTVNPNGIPSWVQVWLSHRH